jgi:uncharacterized protein YkwD
MEAHARKWVLGAAATTLAVLATAPTVLAAPTLLSTRFNRGAVAGRALELQVRARDAAAPVTGMVAGFGSHESGFGLSSCLPPDSAGRTLEPPGDATLAAPHTYGTAGVRQVAATVSSGGCDPTPATTLQQATVTVVPVGQAPKPLIVIPPVTLPPLTLPQLPGLGQIPLPGGITLPGLGARASACPGARSRVIDTVAGRREARDALLCLMNRERRRRGLRPVRMNPSLTRAAQTHSRAMVRDRFFAHVGPGRAATLTSRLRAARYIPRRGAWAVGENIGFGTGVLGSPLAMHRAWMHSTPHRHDILQPRFREAGFGIYRGAPYMRDRGATYTVDFGVRRR